MSRPYRFFLLLLIAVGFACMAPLARADVTLLQLVSGLSQPVDIANAGDNSGRLFVAEQGGRIRIIQNGTLLATPFLDLTTAPTQVVSGGERGLLGIAFHPQYASNGYFFIYFTAHANLLGQSAEGDIVIARFQRSANNPNVADRSSQQLVIAIPHRQGNTYHANHNGGALRFGPNGYLYAGVGDGGSGGDPFNAGQNLNNLLGKIIRLDIDTPPYAIPPTNPFANGIGPGNAVTRPEIWAYGVRNPWRISFDRVTGDFYVADVGQDEREEVNFQAANFAGGANYGWRIREGTLCYSPSSNCVNPPNYVAPLLEYDHGEGVSITGGYVYRGLSTPDMAGKYLFGDFSFSKLWFAPGDAGAPYTQLTSLTPQVSTFGEGETGELYLAAYGGTIFSFSSSTDITPDAIAFFPLNRVAPSTVLTSNTVRITGLGTNAAISVGGGSYSIGCTGTFTTAASTIANNTNVCVRHTSSASDGGVTTTTLTVGTANFTFRSTTELLALTGVLSRKNHGTAGDLDMALDRNAAVTGAVTVEPRAIGSGHLLVFEFDHPIVAAGTVTAVDQLGAAIGAIGSVIVSGNRVLVTLTGIADARRVRVNLTGTNGNSNHAVSVGFLVGDADGNGAVGSADLGLVRQQAGQSSIAGGMRHDLNASGVITAADIAAARARSGRALP